MRASSYLDLTLIEKENPWFYHFRNEVLVKPNPDVYMAKRPHLNRQVSKAIFFPFPNYLYIMLYIYNFGDSILAYFCLYLLIEISWN